MVQIDLFIKQKTFNIEETIKHCFYCHNYKFIHSSTGIKPIEIKDLVDEFIINEIIKKEKKEFERFEKGNLDWFEYRKNIYWLMMQYK